MAALHGVLGRSPAKQATLLPVPRMGASLSSLPCVPVPGERSGRTPETTNEARF
jgi:hypothetical protein